MSSYYKNRRRNAKPAAGYFNYADLQQAYRTIVTMHDAMLSALTPNIDEATRFMLLGDVPAGYNHQFRLNWEPKNVRLRCQVAQPLAFDMNYEFNPETDPALVTLINEYVDNYIEIKRDYGRLQAVVKHFLGREEYTKKEVRYFFPGIIALVKTEGLEDVVAPKRAVALERPIRLAVGKAGLTVASGVMFRDMKFNTHTRIRPMGTGEDGRYYEEGFEFRDYSEFM